MDNNINEGTINKMEKNKKVSDPIMDPNQGDSCNEPSDEDVHALPPSTLDSTSLSQYKF